MSIEVTIGLVLPYDACVEVLEMYGTYDDVVRSVKGEDQKKEAVVQEAKRVIEAGSIEAESLISLVPYVGVEMLSSPNSGRRLTFNAKIL